MSSFLQFPRNLQLLKQLNYHSPRACWSILLRPTIKITESQLQAKVSSQTMGGNAFNAQGYETPRMDQESYARLKTLVHSRLSTVYSRVACPIEPPEKASYGD